MGQAMFGLTYQRRVLIRLTSGTSAHDLTLGRPSTRDELPVSKAEDVLLRLHRHHDHTDALVILRGT